MYKCVFLVLFLCHLDVLALALVRLAVVQLEDDKAQSLGPRKDKLHKYMLHLSFYPIKQNGHILSSFLILFWDSVKKRIFYGQADRNR